MEGKALLHIIRFSADANVVKIAQICGDTTVKISMVAGVTLAVIFVTNPELKTRIIESVERIFGGDRDDQDRANVRPGSLLILLRCKTDARFLEVLENYESGKLKEEFEKEFAEMGIEVESLRVEIINTDEVRITKAAIMKRMSAEDVETKSKDTEKIMASGEEGRTPNTANVPRIIVQGGAYSKKTREVYRYLEFIRKSARQGYEVLRVGGTAVDAVEAAVRVLEDDPTFNAGLGSCLNEHGEVECDAMIMDGHTMKTGAVIAASHFPNPVTISKKIMEETPHCALTGEGAVVFARKKGYTDLLKEPIKLKGKAHLYEGSNDFEKFVKLHYGEGAVPQEDDERGEVKGEDEVSAVAMDGNGYLACAISTGGIPGKWKGRVGDVPMVGCGGYANQIGAAATSGHGEKIMQMNLARQVVFNLERGQNAQEAAENAIEKMQDQVKGCGGVIAIDRKGNFGKAHNTGLMIWTSIEDGNEETSEPF